MPSPPPAAPADRQTFWHQLTEPRHVISMLVLYCLAQFVLRLGLSPNFVSGEAVQALFGQSFQWGYEAGHPPLMTWLSWAVLAGSGQSHVAFFFLRYALMALALVAYFAAARLAIGDTRLAALATFTLLTTFAFGWMADSGSPEQVLLLLMLAAFLLAAERAIAEGSWRDHILLGAIAGLGTLSGYAFAVLPAALSLALIGAPRFRGRLQPWRLLVALATALVLVAPYEILGQVPATSGSAKDIARSAGILAVHLIGLVLPYAILFPVLFWNACRPLAAGGDADTQARMRLYDLAMIAAVAIVLVLLFLLDTHALKAPWLYAAAILLPVYLFARVRLSGWTERNGKIYALAVFVIALVSIGGRVAVYETQGEHCRECSAWWPMHVYEDSLARTGFQQGTIVASDPDLGGNLKGVFPDARIVVPGIPPQRFGTPVDGACLAVWGGDGAPPKPMLDYLSTALHAKPHGESTRGDVLAKLNKTERHMAPLSYMLFPPGACN